MTKHLSIEERIAICIKEQAHLSMPNKLSYFCSQGLDSCQYALKDNITIGDKLYPRCLYKAKSVSHYFTKK